MFLTKHTDKPNRLGWDIAVHLASSRYKVDLIKNTCAHFGSHEKTDNFVSEQINRESTFKIIMNKL